MRWIYTYVLVLSSAALMAQSPATPRPTGGPKPQAVPTDWNNHDGYTSLFDGNTLTGWAGDAKVWSVEDNAIVGQYKSPEGARNPETFLILQGKEPADFDLRLEIKLQGVTADSGIQYRSYIAPPTPPRPGAPAMPQADPRYIVGGYQCDANFIGNYTGQVVDGHGRIIVASRSEVVHAETGKPMERIAVVGTREELGGYWHPNEWNQMEIVARGHVLTHILNGHVMAVFIDDDRTKLREKGLIALQTAGSGTVKISFRNVWLKDLQ